MSIAARKFVVWSVLAIIAGGLLGWVYGHPVTGLLVGSLLVVVVNTRKLIQFDQAIRDGESDLIGYGDGIWQQLYSQFRYERDRGNQYKHQARNLFKEFRKSTNAMPDGAIIIDDKNEIITCNRATKRLIGLKRKKDRGQRLDNIFRAPALTHLLQQGDSTLTADIASPLRENEWLNCRVVPYGAEQKLVLVRDVTERITLNKIRRDFVANASHELRSPLTVISGYLESLHDDTQLPKELVQPIAQMQSQARRMTSIVADLLELSRLESDGQATLDETVNVVSLIEGAIEVAVPEGAESRVTVTAESTAKIRGAESDLDSILRNLLANAIRHTPEDGEVEVLWRANEDGGDLIVRDSGEGIAEEHIPRLTERFFRVDRGRSRGNGGFGLGLAIVKHAVERHGGELSVQSTPGEGSEFCVHFPANRVVVT